MAKPVTWAVRVTLPDERVVFLRHGGAIGRGPIATYRTKEAAELDAAALSKRLDIRHIDIIERSHGRQWADGKQAVPIGR